MRVAEAYADEHDSKRISGRLGPAQHEIPVRYGFSERPNLGQREQQIVRNCRVETLCHGLYGYIIPNFQGGTPDLNRLQIVSQGVMHLHKEEPGDCD